MRKRGCSWTAWGSPRSGRGRGEVPPSRLSPTPGDPHPSRAQLLTARCPRARWTQQRNPRGLQPCTRRHASLGSRAESTPGDGEPHPATGGVAEQARRRRKGRTAEEAPPPTHNFRLTSAFGARAHGRLRESGVVDACALTSSWAGGPRCRPGSISRLAAPTLGRWGSTCEAHSGRLL